MSRDCWRRRRAHSRQPGLDQHDEHRLEYCAASDRRVLGTEPAESPAPEQAIETALKSRADFKLQHKREDSARLSYSSAKLERLPSIVGYADYGDLSGVQTHTAGLALRLPIFDGGRMESDRAQTLSLVLQEEHSREGTQEPRGVGSAAGASDPSIGQESGSSCRPGGDAGGRRIGPGSTPLRVGGHQQLEVIDAETKWRMPAMIVSRRCSATRRLELTWHRRWVPLGQ